jgi:hypothetical protein
MVVGALGTNPSTYDGTSAAALQALGEMGCPVDDENLGLFVPFAVNRAVKTGAISLPSAVQPTTKQFRTGYVEHTDGFDWYRSNSLYTHTTGVWATLPRSPSPARTSPARRSTSTARPATRSRRATRSRSPT